MADEQGQKPAHTLTRQLSQEIAANVSSRFRDFRCAVRASEDFEILNGGADDFISDYAVHKQVERRNTATVETIGIACTNCGHIYQFALEILRVCE